MGRVWGGIRQDDAMLVWGAIDQSSGVASAIRQAADATGTSFNYLLATARVESGLDPEATAKTSSAGGLFQFIDQTWLATLKNAGPSLGYGRYAQAISRNAAGRYEVADPNMRRAIMALRQDPAANAAMAGAFTRSNAQRLQQKIGREPSESELYMAHFLGAAGAARLINAAASNPSSSATDLFPNAASANRSIFYDRSGKARSVSQVYGVLTRRFDVALAASSKSVMPATAAAAPSPASPPVIVAANVPAQPVSTAPAADAGFRSLFSDADNRSALSGLVHGLWGANGTAAPKEFGNLFADKS
jgi:hypothetical protein